MGRNNNNRKSDLSNSSNNRKTTGKVYIVVYSVDLGYVVREEGSSLLIGERPTGDKGTREQMIEKADDLTLNNPGF